MQDLMSVRYVISSWLEFKKINSKLFCGYMYVDSQWQPVLLVGRRVEYV